MNVEKNYRTQISQKNMEEKSLRRASSLTAVFWLKSQS